MPRNEEFSIQENGKRITLERLVVPKYLELMINGVFNTVNTILLSGYSQQAVVATGVAGQILGLIAVFSSAINTGTSIILNISLGRRESKEVLSRILFTGLLLNGAFGLLAGGLACWAAPGIMTLMNVSEASFPLAVRFFRIRAVFLPVMFLSGYFTSLFLCFGYTKYAFLVSIVSSAVNLGCSYLVIYDPFAWGFDATAGIAGANVIASAASAGLAAALFFRTGRRFVPSLDPACIRRILRVGLPAAVSAISYSLSQTVTTGIMTGMGDDVMSTKIYLSNIFGYVAQVSTAVGISSSVFMGRFKGAQEYEKARRFFRRNLALAVLGNGLCAVLVAVVHRPLVGLFHPGEEVFRLAAVIVWLDVATEMARAVNHISENALNATGDVVFPLVVSAFSCWVFSIGGCWLLGKAAGLALVGCWIAFTADEMFRAGVYLRRWHQCRWMETLV